MAAKGDTTIQMKFETAGVSQAKQLAVDLYRSQHEEIQKAAREQRAIQAQERAANAEAKRQARELAAVQRKADMDAARALKDKEAKANMVSKSLTRMGMAALYGFAGFAGAAGIGSVLSNVASAASELSDKRDAFENVITPLVSLGDNVNRMSEMRAEVLGLAAAMGRSNQEAANFLESVDSLSNAFDPKTLSEIKKESLELTELMGGDMQTNMKLMAKTNIAYGDSFKTINHMQNMLLKTQSDADVPMEEFAYRMPELMSSVEAFGFTFEETAAGIIAATLALGRAEGAFTGLRNVFAIMSEAETKGIKFSGSLVDRLKQLKVAADSGKVSILEVFGRDPTAAAAALKKMIDGVGSSIAELKAIDPMSDTVGDRLNTKFEDSRYAASRKSQLAKSLLENSPIIADGANANFLQRMMHNYQLGALAGDEYSGGFPGSQKFGGIGAVLGASEWRVAGVERMLKNAPEGTDLHKSLMEDLKYEERKLFEGSARTERNPDTSPGAPIAIPRVFTPTSAADAPSLEKTLDIAKGIDDMKSILGKQLKIMEAAGGMRQPGGNPDHGREN